MEEARRAGQVILERTGVVLNGPVVAWEGGALPVDDDPREYLGAGQLLEPPDRRMRRVTFKLHECFPGSRYIVADTALAPMAEGMNTRRAWPPPPEPGRPDARTSS